MELLEIAADELDIAQISPLNIVDLEKRRDHKCNLSFCQHREILFSFVLRPLELLSLNSGVTDLHEAVRSLGNPCGFETHLVVAEYNSDVVQILHGCCLVDLCQPFSVA